MASTAASVLVVWKPAAGFGLGTIIQRVPSQCSIRVLKAPPVLKEPTAQTSLAEVAATALSVADPVLGLGLTVQPAQARWPAAAGDAVARAESTNVATVVSPVAVRAIHGMSSPLARQRLARSVEMQDHAMALLPDLAASITTSWLRMRHAKCARFGRLQYSAKWNQRGGVSSGRLA